MTTVAIAGVTGKFARCVAHNLLQRSEVSLRGLCRNTGKLPISLSSSPRVKIVQGEANDRAAAKSLVQGSDVVICCYLGDNRLMTDGQKILIDACEEEKISRYIASDYTIDFTKLEYGQLPVKDPMKHVKEYVDSKTHVKGVHVMIGVFMETFFSPFFNIWQPKENKLRFWGSGHEVWESTSYDNAARYVASVALDEQAVGIQKFLGDKKTVEEMAAVFESVYRVKPQLEILGSLDDLYNHMHETRKKKPSAFFDYIPMFYQYYCSNGQTSLGSNLDNSRYPDIKPATFRDFFKQHKLEELTGAYQAAGSLLK